MEVKMEVKRYALDITTNVHFIFHERSELTSTLTSASEAS